MEDSARIPVLGEPPDDAALLKRFVERNDRQAMGILFSRHADAAYRLALRVCRHAADAEDAVQAAFFEMLRHAAKYRGESAVKPWIFGFVVNACRHKAREEGRRAAREERAAAATGEGAPREDPHLQSAVRNAVQELPDPYRVPIWLHYCEGLTSGEVAETLSLSENTVRSQLSRGVDQLRTSLATTGLSVSGAALTGALAAAAAAETAPATLTATLAGIASGAVPAAAKVGFLAKLAAGTVALAAVVSTAGFLWVGEPDPPPPLPPEFAWIQRRVDEWQPTREEKRFDEVAWAKDLRRARELSRQHGRPQLVITFAGRMNQGRSDGGAISLRGGALSDAGVIRRLNESFVPVYVVNDDHDREGTDPVEERKEFQRIYREALDGKLFAGTECLYFLDPASGKVFDSIHMCKVTTANLIEKLDRIASERSVTAGPPASPPSPQCVPPPAGPENLVLHVTARYLDKGGNPLKGGSDYDACPAEEWVVLTKDESSRLLPPNGDSQVDPAVARKLFAHFYPVTGNWNPASQILEHTLHATVVLRHPRTVWVRLEGGFKLKHPFFPNKDDDNVAVATTAGYVEIDPASGRVRTFRMVTDGGRYGSRPFGVALRSHR